MTEIADGLLMLTAKSLDGIEDLRIATENRIRQLTRDVEDSDGEVRGLGLSEMSPEVQAAKATLEGLVELEKLTTKELQRRIRKHPLYSWVKTQKGVGEKQAARLLASLGDPYWNTLYNRPRTVSELWSYCGYAAHNGEIQRRKKGQKSNWNSEVKMRTYLISTSCIKKMDGNYRKVYDTARDKYRDSDISLGQQHNRALRAVSKEILKDLWLASREIHSAQTGI